MLPSDRFSEYENTGKESNSLRTEGTKMGRKIEAARDCRLETGYVRVAG